MQRDHRIGGRLQATSRAAQDFVEDAPGWMPGWMPGRMSGWIDATGGRASVTDQRLGGRGVARSLAWRMAKLLPAALF